MPGSIVIDHCIQKRQVQIQLFVVFLFVFPLAALSQSHNYWTRSFNEESSLLSGAVVGGGSGASAIYYNPANISEVKASSLSVNASLFSFDFMKVRNALGDGINLSSTKASVEPRFLSYMIKGKRHPSWSFEVAFLNNENTKSEFIQSVDERLDILSQTPGEERYFAVYRYDNQFRDDWVSIGSSVKISDKLYLGLGIYVIVKSLSYSHTLDIEAYSTQDSIGAAYYPSSLAIFQRYQFLKFNDYRINTKLGVSYKSDRYSFGFCFTSPSVGNIYSDGKRTIHKESQINIYDPATGEPVPSYTIIDYKQKKDMDVSFKTPFSVSAGFTYELADGKRIFYSSVEYFNGLAPYRMVEAEESDDIASGSGFNQMIYTDWLTFVAGARPVFNVSVGYSWTLRDDLLLMAGFRTDFNYQKNVDFGEFSEYSKVQNLDLDLYYITCGLSWNVLGQDIITGLQYSVGRTDGQKQIANLAEPVEYSPVEHLALQGDPKYNMVSVLNAISVYFGASFNWGSKEK
jgi:hypothetical protein